LLRFLMRWSMPSNPATRGRDQFNPLEARGAKLFASHCEGCHQARLVVDDPGTRVGLGPGGDLEPWRRMIFASNGPLTWGSDAYAQTGIVPWVHPEGARIPALRRLYLKWPYFTNGGADSLEAVLEGVRLREGAEPSSNLASDHELGPASADTRGLAPEQRAALLAFLRLL
jgi:cytochrome c peroxidase